MRADVSPEGTLQIIAESGAELCALRHLNGTLRLYTQYEPVPEAAYMITKVEK